MKIFTIALGQIVIHLFGSTKDRCVYYASNGIAFLARTLRGIGEGTYGFAASVFNCSLPVEIDFVTSLPGKVKSKLKMFTTPLGNKWSCDDPKCMAARDKWKGVDDEDLCHCSWPKCHTVVWMDNRGLQCALCDQWYCDFCWQTTGTWIKCVWYCCVESAIDNSDSET